MKINSVLTDGLAMQDVAILLKLGLINAYAKDLKLIDRNGNYKYELIPQGVIQLESLINFLYDLILKDEIVVDKRYRSLWKGSYQILDELEIIKLIVSKEFKDQNNQLNYTRNEVLNQFNLPTKIKNYFFDETGMNKTYSQDVQLSLMIHGAASNISKASILETGYTPHPLRRSILNHVYNSSQKNSLNIISEIVKKQRVEYIANLNKEEYLNLGEIFLEPIVVSVIEESNTIDDLFKVALQVRNHKRFVQLRKFLSEFQEAIIDEDIKKLQGITSILNSLDEIKELNLKDHGSITLKLFGGILNFSIKPNLKFAIDKNYRIKTTIQEMILGKGSRSTLKKLIKMFDSNFDMTEEIIDHFLSRKNIE